jgi:hypothetical protein
MKVIKYSLPFVKKGKAFVIPNWTVEKHEKAIAVALESTKNKKELNETQKENELKYAIIYETLVEIDESVELDSIRKYFTHPENLVEMFNVIYYAGKKDIYFHEALNQKSKKKSSI